MPRDDKPTRLFGVVQPSDVDIQEVAGSINHGCFPIVIEWLKTYQNHIRLMNESKPQKNSLDLSTSTLYRLGQCNILEEIIQLPKATRKAVMKLECKK